MLLGSKIVVLDTFSSALLTFTAVLKKILAIGSVLFALLLLVQAGIDWYYLIKKQMIRMEVRQKYLEGFIGDELMFLEIPVELEKTPNSSFRRIHAGEFVYLGQMYDIVDQQQVGNVTWYLVYPDRKETALKQKMKKRMDDFESGASYPVPEQLKLTLFYDNAALELAGTESPERLNHTTVYCFSTKEWISESPFHPPCCG